MLNMESVMPRDLQLIVSQICNRNIRLLDYAKASILLVIWSLWGRNVKILVGRKFHVKFESQLVSISLLEHFTAHMKVPVQVCAANFVSKVSCWCCLYLHWTWLHEFNTTTKIKIHESQLFGVSYMYLLSLLRHVKVICLVTFRVLKLLFIIFIKVFLGILFIISSLLTIVVRDLLSTYPHHLKWFSLILSSIEAISSGSQITVFFLLFFF